MSRVKLYVCDGNAEGCRKNFCSFAGTGDCAHTTDKRHARYKGPREWEVSRSGTRTILFEKVREEC